MTSTASLLVELFVEELPPKALNTLGNAFANTLARTLKAQHLVADNATTRTFASPRRLGVIVSDVLAQAPQQQRSQRLMPVKVGFKDAQAGGEASPALLKKLGSMGLDESALPDLRVDSSGKDDMLFLDQTVAGATLQEGLQAALDEAIAKLPVPKMMGYQLHTGCELPGWSSVEFVRPVHGLLALHGSSVVPVQALGLHAGNSTTGHRFEAASDTITIASADAYEQTLENQGAVIAHFDTRRELIRQQLQTEANKAEGNVEPLWDEDLLDEVTALVERPNVLLCAFEKEFLEVPQECLILTMQANQKYFPLVEKESKKLSHQFLIVSNIQPDDPSAIIAGNERVIRPRLADAKFFFETDRKKPLESLLPRLEKVVYHSELGSQAERGARVQRIAAALAEALQTEKTDVQTAAQLAKADLLTEMVGEFPELQGTMGYYYALAEGQSQTVAEAIEDHYKPRFAGDTLPRNTVGSILALADKLETLVGLFGIGQLPTGDKDPFALRRHALGVLRILVEQRLNIRLPELLDKAAAAFGALISHPQESNQKLTTFIYERLDGYLRDQGYSAQQVAAVTAVRPVWGEIPQCLAAVAAFASLPEAPALAAANKRIGNILKKSDADIADNVQSSLLTEAAEKALHSSMQTIAPQADEQFQAGDYTQSLQSLAGLKEPVDAFFEHVMVNADDPALKANRLALLQQLHTAMNRVADLSKLSS